MEMEISLKDVSKSYGGLPVLRHVDLHFQGPGSYCLMGPSGVGKTTLLRLILGLERPDQGAVTGLECQKAAVFQEDRLCEAFTPLENVSMVADRAFTRGQITAALSELLPGEALCRPVMTLSGGMKRRTAICRALMASSDAVIMDEPFTGLDQATKHTVIRLIKDYTAGKLLIVSTHQAEDVGLIGALPVSLDFPEDIGV